MIVQKFEIYFEWWRFQCRFNIVRSTQEITHAGVCLKRNHNMIRIRVSAQFDDKNRVQLTNNSITFFFDIHPTASSFKYSYDPSNFVLLYNFILDLEICEHIFILTHTIFIILHYQGSVQKTDLEAYVTRRRTSNNRQRILHWFRCNSNVIDALDERRKRKVTDEK